jgi:hypothetical protein
MDVRIHFWQLLAVNAANLTVPQSVNVQRRVTNSFQVSFSGKTAKSSIQLASSSV